MQKHRGEPVGAVALPRNALLTQAPGANVFIPAAGGSAVYYGTTTPATYTSAVVNS